MFLTHGMPLRVGPHFPGARLEGRNDADCSIFTSVTVAANQEPQCRALAEEEKQSSSRTLAAESGLRLPEAHRALGVGSNLPFIQGEVRCAQGECAVAL